MGGRSLADKRKKILILYASSGHGHEKAAKAVFAACQSREDCAVKVLDVLDLTSFAFGRLYRALYFFLIKNAAWLWGFFYGITDWPWVYFFVKPLRRANNHFFAAQLEALLRSEQPDIVISTHFLASETTAFLKKNKLLSSRLLTIITDYMPHAFWIAQDTDIYAVATSKTKENLQSRGVPKEKIHVTGIPIEPKFSSVMDRKRIALSLGLDADAFTVLITSGGAGVGIAQTLVDRMVFVEPPIQQLVVCGTNRDLFNKLHDKHVGKRLIHLFGFVENIHELMASSDLVIGKGGGLTITESLCVGRPMILFGAVPGQETRNVKQIVGCGAAKSAHSVQQVVEFVAEFRRSEPLRRKTKDVIETLRCADSAQRILWLALDLEK